MALRGPTDEEFERLVEELGIPLSEEERAILPDFLAGTAAAYALIEQEPDALPDPIVREREWWRPGDGENPHAAWSVRTAIRERGDGPLAGMRVAAKDNVMVGGVPMLNGSATFEGYVPEVDATVVRRLLEAGAEIAGKAHCENYCLSAGSHTNNFARVHNPHRRGHTTGGSSSGCAALVAAGEVELAIGGDQGGSIRLPASYCGIVGMKPTWGLVPYTGIAPIEPNIDHVGPMTANVRDNARMLEVMAGPDGYDPRQQGAPSQAWSQQLEGGVAGLRVALLAEGFGTPDSEPEVDAVVRSAAGVLEKLGAVVETASVPLHRVASALAFPLTVEGAYRTLVTGDGMGSGRMDLYVPSYLERQRRWREQAAALSPLMKAITVLGAWVDRTAGLKYYGKAVNVARRIRAAYDEVFAEADVLLMPTTPTVAPPLPTGNPGVLESIAAASFGIVNTQPFDVSHHPALSVPCGQLDGLPVGMMLVGRHLAEATLYRAAYAFEQAGDWQHT